MKGDNQVPTLISSGGFDHDLIRYYIIRWCQKHGYTAYSEPRGFGEYRPDLEIRQKKKVKSRVGVAYIEIQKDLNVKWLKKELARYMPKTLIIFDLNHFNVKNTEPEAVYRAVSEQMDLETSLYNPPTPESLRKRLIKPEAKGDYMVTLEDGRRVKAKNRWKHERDFVGGSG